MEASTDEATRTPAHERELEQLLKAIEDQIIDNSRLGDPATVHRLIREWNALSAEAH